MTGELIPLPTFEGSEIRAIEQIGAVWMPLVDLAYAWGLKPNTLYQIVARNEKKFEGFSAVVHVTCTDTLQCVNEQGLYLLMGAINTDRLHNITVADAILRFQRWVPELIQRYRKKEIVQTPVNGIDTELQQARHLAEQTGGNLASFQAIALKKCGFEDYVPALNIPQIIHGETGWYNPTRLISLCNDPDLTPERLNWYLRNKGYQYRDGYIWRLTPEGRIHGKEYWFTAASGHQEIRIAWRESVLFASGLKRSISGDQVALTAKV
jgi:prophage antirepressor-like protein